MANRITKTSQDKPISTRDEVNKFLQKVRQTPVSPSLGKGRLIFAVDATMSRQALWDQASQLQAEMFLAAGEASGLQVQFAYYRGLMDFHGSSWMDHPEALLREMTSVHCMAGHTQIERVLRHIKNETEKKKVQAAVFVGDAVEEGENTLIKLAGELGLVGTPLFMFQEGYSPEVKAVYSKMAQLSGGAYCHFDDGSVEQLKELLGAVAVYASGGYKALEHYSKKRSHRLSAMTKQLPWHK